MQRARTGSPEDYLVELPHVICGVHGKAESSYGDITTTCLHQYNCDSREVLVFRCIKLSRLLISTRFFVALLAIASGLP